MKQPKVVAFVPAKASSSRVPNKNTRPFNGEPFFLFTVHKLLKCPFISEVYVDSESPEILELARNAGALPLARDPALASNKTDGHALFYNEVRQIEADIYIQHLCTSPFIKPDTIKRGIEYLINTPGCDSVVLGKSEKQYGWKNNRPLYNLESIPNSVDLPDTITEAMGLYIVDRDTARRTRRRIGDAPHMIFGDPIELVDVNSENDMELANIIGAGVLSKEEKRLKVLGRFLTSPLLSDIADELSLECVLPPHYVPNIPDVKMFGRARTLSIRSATSDDKPNSIYDALQSYKTVVSNDIIVVQNEEPELAYFGDLNMSLAIRSGAVGAIIGGVTRDTRATKTFGFPVFAKGRYCRDIKGKGAVASINKQIILDGFAINPSDLIFADSDGIVVIPRAYEEQFLQKAIENMNTESNIIRDICSDIDTASLVDKHGFF